MHYPEVKPKFLNRETITTFVLNTLGNNLLCHLIILIINKRGSEKIAHSNFLVGYTVKTFTFSDGLKYKLFHCAILKPVC